MNVFRVLQKNHRRLKRLLEVTPFAREEMEVAYGQVKDPVERARRTIIRSFMGFGADSVTRDCRTGFRSNSNRAGTTPAHDWARWPAQIDAFHSRMTGVVIENRDAKEVMASQDSPETLHYVDPPYVWETRADKSGSHGYRHEMSDEQHEDLLQFLQGLKGMVILSGYANPIYEKLPWEKVRTETLTFHKHNIGAPRTEVLWMNPAAIEAQAQRRMF